MPSLLQRLKERKIVQWAIVYLAGAWLFLEALGFVADTFAWPAFVARSAIVLAAVGFLAVLVLAWYHGEKGRQKASGVELLILAGILVIAGAAVALLGRGGEEADEPTAEQREAVATAADRATIAVLPFENLSPAADDAFFTDGIHDEVISRLGNVTGLKVTSRTSVMEYRAEARNVREIARELGVRNIVEGTVRRAGDRVRITAQLIDAEVDAHLWAQSYERELRDIFAIQSEVAEQIVAALRVSLTPSERAQIEARATDNIEAYDFYLRGNQFGVGDEEGKRIAIEMYERAVELDPGFAVAYARLATEHVWIYHEYYDRTPERLALAKQAIDRALSLQPGMAAGRLALGLYYYRGLIDFDRALEQFEIVLKEKPENADVHRYLGALRRRQGDFEQSLASYERAVELDPRNPQILLNLAQTYETLRNYERAAVTYERAIALRPDWPSPYTYLARLYLLWLGAPDSARAVLELGSKRAGPADPDNDWVWTRVVLAERDLDQALRRISQAPAVLDPQLLYYPKDLLYAEAHALLGDRDSARVYYDSARAFLELKIREQPEDSRMHSGLGIAYAGLGRKEGAIREGRLAVELMPVSKDAFVGPFRLEDLARIHAMVGEYDAAVEQLDSLLSIPSRFSAPLLRIDPTWDPLRDHPQFQALLDKYD